MLQLVFSRVKVDQVDRLRSWMGELMARPQEVRQTFEQEGVHHEMAFLVEAREGPLLVYAIEVEDDDRARQAFEHSTLPIDQEHRRTMDEVLVNRGQASVELLYELRR